jgi:hypothetical protein
MRKISTGILGLLLAAGVASTVRADSLFDFESVPVNTLTTFTTTDPASSVSATFRSFVNGTDTPGLFVVGPDPDGIGSGNRLIEIESSNTGSIRIDFGTQFQSAAFPFAINAPPGDILSVSALLGGAPVGTTTTATANTPFLFYSLGSLSFNPGVSFDSLLVSASDGGGVSQQFGIDDVSVSPAVSGVPEPAPAALLIIGLGSLLACIRYRQQRSAVPVL